MPRGVFGDARQLRIKRDAKYAAVLQVELKRLEEARARAAAAARAEAKQLRDIVERAASITIQCCARQRAGRNALARRRAGKALEPILKGPFNFFLF